MKRYIITILSLLLLLSGCGNTKVIPSQQPEEDPAETAFPELESTEWQVLSTDAETFNLNGSFDNPNFEYVWEHTNTVPLDQLVAFLLVADGASEGADEELRSRFLEAPNTILAYLVLLGDQITELPGWEPTPTAELLCEFIASADVAWHNGSEEFASTIAECRKNYQGGRIAELLDIMEAKYNESMESMEASKG